MDSFIWLIATIIGIIITYYIIYYATGTGKRKKQLLLQNKILLHIAKQLGVDEEKINELNNFNNNV